MNVFIMQSFDIAMILYILDPPHRKCLLHFESSVINILLPHNMAIQQDNCPTELQAKYLTHVHT